MDFIARLIIFFLFFCVFHWIIRRINLHGKILRNIKHGKIILIIVLILSIFLIEYGKQLSNNLYGQNNSISVILGALSVNLIMLISEGKMSDT